MNKYAAHHRPAAVYPFRGKLLTIAQIAAARGVCFSCVSRRIKAGTVLDRPSQNPHSKKPLPEPEPPRDWQTRGEE